MTQPTTPQWQTLLAVCTAALDEKPDCAMRKALDRKLGAGWALEYAKTRSVEERVMLVNRRIQMCVADRMPAGQ